MPKSLSVEVGDNITLNCTTKGHPKPNLTWIHNGRTITGHHTKSNNIISGFQFSFFFKKCLLLLLI